MNNFLEPLGNLVRGCTKLGVEKHHYVTTTMHLPATQSSREKERNFYRLDSHP